MSDTSSSLSSPSSSLPPTPPNLHQNSIDPSAKWLVQKFGGTSVGKFAAQIAEDVVPNYLDDNKVVIVCSARSGSTKALGTTNLLLKAASEATQTQKRRESLSNGATKSLSGKTGDTSSVFNSQTSGSSEPTTPGQEFSVTPIMTPFTSPTTSFIQLSFGETVDLIRKEHLEMAKNNVRDPEILQELEAEIECDSDWLRSFLYATQIIEEVSARSKDSIVGLGERLSCKIMTAILRDRGIDAEYVSLDNVVAEAGLADGPFEKILDQSFYDRLALALGERIVQCAPKVPVVTGFFGPVPGSLLDQVGRGYTDLCSALLAVGLEASELQIWKEVDGIFTADPRKVATARLIPIISPEEAAELTYYGSEVVHPFTMEQAIRRKVPIRIKNVENPLGGGTVIHPDPHLDGSQSTNANDPSAALNSADATPSALQYPHPGSPENRLSHESRRLPTAVTIKEHIVVINVNSNRKSVSHGFLAGIFKALDRFGVVVDLISTSEVMVSMAIEAGLARKILDRLVEELRKNGTVSVRREMAILSLVGKRMRNMIGIAGRMFTTLAQGNINIEMISQGASEINISCVIEGRDAVKALNMIHQSCLQIKPEGARGRVGPWLF